MKKWLFTSIMVIIYNISLGQTVKTYIDNAGAALLKGDYAVAITNAQNAAKLDRQNPEVFKLLATALYSSKNYEAALIIIEEAIRLKPTESYYLLKANIDKALKKPEDQIEDYTNYLSISDSESIRYLRASTYFSLKKYDLALADLKINLNNKSGSSNNYETISRIYMILKDTTNALNALNDGIANCNFNTSLYFNRATLYHLINKEAEALKDYRTLINLSPTNGSYYFSAAYSASLIGDQKLALRFYEEAVKNGKNNTATYNNIGNALLNMGRPLEAKKYFLKSLEVMPSNQYPLAMLGLLEYRYYDNEKEAFIQADKAVLNQGRFYVSYLTRGYLSLYCGYYDDARADFLKALEVKKDHNSNIALAKYYVAMGDYEGALPFAEAATKSGEQRFQSHNLLAYIYYKLGEVAHAKENYQASFDEYAKYQPNYQIDFNKPSTDAFRLYFIKPFFDASDIDDSTFHLEGAKEFKFTIRIQGFNDFDINNLKVLINGKVIPSNNYTVINVEHKNFKVENKMIYDVRIGIPLDTKSKINLDYLGHISQNITVIK